MIINQLKQNTTKNSPAAKSDKKNRTKCAQLPVIDQFGTVTPGGGILKTYQFSLVAHTLQRRGANDALLFTHNVFKDTAGTKIFINSHKFEK
ncbi:MAG: hypothetical protein JNM41_02185 [Flavipsychrobacter sp.]|nr:hypothetical protein [Flavipsychrobacter sp.]